MRVLTEDKGAPWMLLSAPLLLSNLPLSLQPRSLQGHYSVLYVCSVNLDFHTLSLTHAHAPALWSLCCWERFWCSTHTFMYWTVWNCRYNVLATCLLCRKSCKVKQRGLWRLMLSPARLWDMTWFLCSTLYWRSICLDLRLNSWGDSAAKYKKQFASHCFPCS